MVSDSHRRQGIGRALMLELIAAGRKGGIGIIITTINKNNLASRALVESLGFLPCENWHSDITGSNLLLYTYKIPETIPQAKATEPTEPTEPAEQTEPLAKPKTTLKKIPMHNEAYKQGFANGQADKLFGYGSRYAYASFSTDNEYIRNYSAEYRGGKRNSMG
jgi:hypothetical protein